MDAAQTSASAAAHAAVPGTLLVTGVQARAITEATEQIVGALRQFARGRQATIVPMLQRQLTETFVQRTPEEIAKLLGKEATRERQFLKRQQSRIQRDLPKVLAEADVSKRRQAMGKLLDRERRYMGQRERAMAARAHAVVESLDIQEASPEGAYWKLGYARAHTPGCVAMAGKFWPWSVLREVGIPPVHPACACELMTLNEAVSEGLMKPDAIPDAKDAMLRARRNMALEEAVYDAWPEEYLLVDLEEARRHGHQQRYPKGSELGGAFMPRVGADLRKAKGALGDLLTERGGHREVWLHGNRLKIPRERNFERKISGQVYYSPPGSTNVYRGTTLVDQEGVGPLDDAAKPPAPGRAGAALDLSGVSGVRGLPGGEDEVMRTVASNRAKDALAGNGAPVKVGFDAKATHEGLVSAGFEMRGSSMKGKGTMRVEYRTADKRDLSVDYDRRSGRVAGLHWPSGEKKAAPKYHGPQTTAPAPSRSDKPGKWADWKPPKLFGDSEGKSWQVAPPPEPVVHEPLRASAAEQGSIPDYDHVKIEVSGSKWQTGPRRAVGPDGQKYELKDYDGDADRVASELLANAVYRRMGANVPAAGVRHFGYVPDFASIPDVDLKEPPILSTPGRRISSGIILRDAEGNVTLFEPKGHFGGYEHTFPKGGVEPGLTPQQNAHKELWEETGLHARITGVLGDYEGDTGVSRYYTGVLTGGEPTPGDETEAVKTVPPAEAAELLNKPRDKTILADLLQRPAYLGDPGPDEFPGEVLGPPAVLSPLVDGKPKPITEPSGPLGAHYMTDALLGNWDFASSRSLVWGEDGSPMRVDHSSALAMHGKGRKPFGPVPTEVWSLASPKGQGFGKVKVTPAQKKRQAAEIEKRLTPAFIDELVDEAPFADPALREDTRQALKARVAWMGRYAKGDEVDPVPSTGAEAASELKANQAHMRLFPEQAEALDLYGPEVNQTIMSDTPRGQADPDVRFTIEQLDELLDPHNRAPLMVDDVTAFAGLDSDALPSPDELVGKTVTHRGFLEMGLDEAEARKGKMVMQVLVPAGANALYTRGIPDFKAGTHLPDLLAPRRSRLRVVRVAKRQGKTYVEAVLET